jgi:hypothetical protein
VSALLCAISVALVWNGAGRGCSPHDDARNVASALAYGRLAVAGAGLAVAALLVRAPRGLGWWVAIAALWVAVFVAGVLQFGADCAR